MEFKTVQEERDVRLSVGYARKTINPPKGIGLGGFGNTDQRLSDQVMDDLYVTCTALSDGKETLLLYSVDLLGVSKKNPATVAEWVKENLGIPEHHIFITATHNHSAPNVRDGNKSCDAFLPTFYEAMYQIAKEAVEDLTEAEMSIGSARTQNLNYVRRYLREDGSFHGVGFYTTNTSPLARHESEVDNLMQAIRFERKGAKDVVMVNWQCHVTTTSGRNRTDVSSDWVGRFREEVEKDHDVYFAYYQGAAGNVVPNTYLKTEPGNSDMFKHGKDLCAVLTRALSDMKKVQPRPILVHVKDYYGYKQNDTEGFDLEDAQKVCDAFQAKDLALEKELCLKYGFHSYYHAKGIIGRSKIPDGSGQDIRIGAVSLGPVAFIYGPYEMYDTNGMQIKEGSPFDMTFICAYTNHAFGYIPSALGFKNGGYEVDACSFAAGTGEKLVTEYLNMLNDLKKERAKK